MSTALGVGVSPCLGRPAPFTPAAIPGHVLWLDAASGASKDGAASFPGTIAGSNYLVTGSASAIALSTVAISCWFKTTSPGASYRALAVKSAAYGLFLADSRVTVYDWSGGGNVFVSPITYADGNWHHVVIVLVPGVTNGSSVYIDGVPIGTFTFVGPYGQEYPFALGGSVAGAGQEYAGALDSTGVASTLAAGDVGTLWNGGAGAAWVDLPPALQAKFISFYDLDDTGTRADRCGANPLAMSGAVGWGAGIASSKCGDGDPMSKWVARTGQLATSANTSARGTYFVNGGKPYLFMDAVDDGYAINETTIAPPYTWFVVEDVRAVGSRTLTSPTGNKLISLGRASNSFYLNGEVGTISSPTTGRHTGALLAPVSGYCSAYYDGVNITDGNTSAIDWGSPVIGCTPSQGESANTNIKAILRYNRALTPAEIAKLHAWGLTI